MAFSKLLRRWFSRSLTARQSTVLRRRARPQFESLERRDVPSTLSTISDFVTPTGKNLYVPLTVADGSNTTFTVNSSNSNVQAQLVTGGRSLRLQVSGTDSASVAFSGEMTLRLFEDKAPLATAQIIQLANQSFYNGRIFHRVAPGFVIQGATPTNGSEAASGLGVFQDEFTPDLTFNSPGMLALANAGDDGNDFEFFITDLVNSINDSRAFSINSLNFNHTIFGQLTSGFDVYNKIIHTRTSDGRPPNDITIVSATVFTDDHNGVLKVSAPIGFTGTTDITIGGSDANGTLNSDTFNVQVVADPINDRAFLGSMTNLTTDVGKAITFQIPAVDLDKDQLTFIVRDPSNFSSTSLPRATVTIDQSNGRVTISPQDGFAGGMQLLIGVRDQTLRPTSANSTLNDRDQFDTQIISLSVTGSFDLDPTSDTGAMDDDNVTGSSSPTFTILAPSGDTVNVLLNGVSVGTATEQTPSGSDRFKITLPAAQLKVGANTLTGTAVNGSSTATLSPLTFTYAPSLKSTYVVPGDIGSTQNLAFEYLYTESGFQDEVGVYKVDDYSGKVNGIAPGATGYAAAAIGRRQVLFSPTPTAGGHVSLTVNGGELYGFYLIQNNTSSNFLSSNSANATTGSPVAFFSIAAANPDSGFNHVEVLEDPLHSQASYAWEDLTSGGDRDYNDLVLGVHLASATLSEALTVAGSSDVDVPTTFQLQSATQSVKHNNPATVTTASGEVGVFAVDDASGKIGNLSPGDDGYASAALGRRVVLFANGAAANTSVTKNLGGGTFLGFYYVPGNTAAQVLAANPTNSVTTSPVAFFSFTAANPDDVDHFRSFNPEVVSRPAATASDPIRLHFMGIANGGKNDFDDVVFTMKMGS